MVSAITQVQTDLDDTITQLETGVQSLLSDAAGHADQVQALQTSVGRLKELATSLAKPLPGAAAAAPATPTGNVDAGTPAAAPMAPALPLYEYTGSGTPDPAAWPTAAEHTPDGKPLYHFSGDTPGGGATGASPGWAPYTGPTS